MVTRLTIAVVALSFATSAYAQTPEESSGMSAVAPIEVDDAPQEPESPAQADEPAPLPAPTPSTQPAPAPVAEPASAPVAPAPPAAAPVAAPAPTAAPAETAPEAEEEDDDGWGVMYIRLQGGLSYANLLSFNQDNFIPEAEETRGTGPFGGLAVGFRVYWFTLGATATFGRQGGFDLGTVGAEFAFHIPIPRVQPYVRIAAGYAWVGRYDFQSRDLAETDIYGLTIEAGAGIDIKILSHLSIGAGLDAAFLNLTRQELGTVNVIGVDLEESGDALGFQLRAHAHLTIHI